MQVRASPRGLAVAVISLALLATVSGAAWATLDPPWVQELAFDVTVTGEGTEGESWTYTYTAAIPEDGSGEDVYGWFLTGAYGIDPNSISHTDLGDYDWYPGEIVQPGFSPSNWPAAGLVNNTGGPVIWWVQEDLSGSGTGAGDIGTFSFVSSKPPMNREWLGHSDGTAYVTGWTEGADPRNYGLLLLLGQGVPILGLVGLRRRRKS